MLACREGDHWYVFETFLDTFFSARSIASVIKVSNFSYSSVSDSVQLLSIALFSRFCALSVILW